MALKTIHRPEFAEYLRRILGGLTNEQVAIRTELSAEYIRKMRKTGLVPTQSVLDNLANGMGVDLNEVLIAAGYVQEPRPTPEETMNIVTLALNEEKELDTDVKQRLLESIREKLEKLLREKTEGKTQ